MPSESGWQHAPLLLLQFPVAGGLRTGTQQSFLTLHELVAVLHVCPGSLQAPPLSHRPYWSVASVLEHVVPQQSLVFWQISPLTWQPVGSWQTSNPF
jgi:hypothetical protein